MSKNWAAKIILIFALATNLFAKAGDGEWLLRVPDNERDRVNPLEARADAAAAGAKIFRQSCASCHGEGAEGKIERKHFRPNLHSGRVKQATPGELFWLLTNGSQKNGMPSWSRLPDAQRWQIITFLKSLN
jgi:mono/diheme cytochrome c family protein